MTPLPQRSPPNRAPAPAGSWWHQRRRGARARRSSGNGKPPRMISRGSWLAPGATDGLNGAEVALYRPRGQVSLVRRQPPRHRPHAASSPPLFDSRVVGYGTITGLLGSSRPLCIRRGGPVELVRSDCSDRPRDAADNVAASLGRPRGRHPDPGGLFLREGDARSLCKSAR